MQMIGACMKFIYPFFCALLVTAFMVASCVRHRETSEIITELKALELAKKEFVRSGRKVEDYRVSVETDSGGQEWIVWFDRKTEYPVPGGKHAVTVEKATGKAVFMQGE